ncbi:hypothetical protein J4423_02235 [Candidatus Pacearchaeota archaeon]|nr:hypothetical protein [Candidatus Pacearchaeota archaeon]
MKYSKKLLFFLESFVSGKINALVFSKDYDLFFGSNKSNIKKEVSNESFEIFDDISIDIAYFEPNPKLRSEYEGYLDEPKLLFKVKNHYSKLKGMLK